MQKDLQIAAFEGGALRSLYPNVKTREVVLGLPLSRLILRLVRVPAEGDLNVESAQVLKAASPFPDEILTVSTEIVRQTERETVAIAAALPESAADDIAEALDAAKLDVVKIDALAIGALRGLWSQLGDLEAEPKQRRLVVLSTVDCLSLVVLDGAEPSAIRAVSAAGDLRREVMLSLLEAEDFGGAIPLTEIVWAETERQGEGEGEGVGVGEEALKAFGVPVKRLTIGADAALVGVAERATEGGTLDARPGSWREVLAETRFKAKVVRNLTIAGCFWLLVMGVLFGVPVAYGYLTDHQAELCLRHKSRYKAVFDKREKVKVVQKYSDHSLGSLEILRAVSDRLPADDEGEATLTSWDFERGDGVHFKGEATSSKIVYRLKDALAAMRPVGEDGEEDPEAKPIFTIVKLGPLSAQKGGKQRFDIECHFEAPEEP